MLLAFQQWGRELRRGNLAKASKTPNNGGASRQKLDQAARQQHFNNKVKRNKKPAVVVIRLP
jgi:hypothetical protein